METGREEAAGTVETPPLDCMIRNPAFMPISLSLLSRLVRYFDVFGPTNALMAVVEKLIFTHHVHHLTGAGNINLRPDFLDDLLGALFMRVIEEENKKQMVMASTPCP